MISKFSRRRSCDVDSLLQRLGIIVVVVSVVSAGAIWQLWARTLIGAMPWMQVVVRFCREFDGEGAGGVEAWWLSPLLRTRWRGRQDIPTSLAVR